MAERKGENAALDNSTSQKTQEPIPPLWVSYVKLTRIHKFPAGSILVYWPSSWGLTLVAYSIKLPSASLCVQLLMYLVGCTLRHNAACIWNDICDRDIDKKVERTRGRPIARGLVSTQAATVFLLAHIILCVLILSYVNNGTARYVYLTKILPSFKVGLFGLLFVDMLYPLTKRWTNWPQAWLGIAMTWGLLVAWISNAGYMNWSFIPVLFFGGIWGFSWTLHYDTIYACQDRKDDIVAGIRSTAVLFGDNVRLISAAFSTCFVLCLAWTGFMNSNGPAYFILSVFGSALHFIWQLSSLDFDNGPECWRMFKANGTGLGFLILSGMLCDYALKVLL
ncbi:4-hydroxybenzoate polyprenyltransferase, mitochondrial [Leucoagaricus sp. SymC.cos]|nr:4-hydroxybenzoate polyprenyltransferase, mitochondrial [Leucoagaricus sp. SymC.cos]